MLSIASLQLKKKLFSINRFIYCEELNLTGETVMQILYASKKYIIPAITTQCSTFLEQELTSENVCTILDQALIFEEQDLVEKCLTVVKQNTAEVFGTDGFMTLSYSAVAKLLELQELSVREIDVFKACMKWARDKIKKDTGEEIRQKLGDLLYKIRFPVMTAEEFSLHVSPVGVLSHVEEIACFRYICSGQGKDNLPFIAQTRGIIPKALFCGLERPYETTLVPINNGSSFQNLNITSCGERSIMDKTPTKVSGLRLLCTEGDSFSLKISRKLRMEKHKRLPYRMSQTYETIYAIDKHPVTSLMMDEEETYADIYFPNEHTVDLEVGDNYRFEVNLSHCSTSAENIVFQQYALVDHVIFRHNDHVASSIHRFAQEKTLMLGILVKED